MRYYLTLLLSLFIFSANAAYHKPNNFFVPTIDEMSPALANEIYVQVYRTLAADYFVIKDTAAFNHQFELTAYSLNERIWFVQTYKKEVTGQPTKALEHYVHTRDMLDEYWNLVLRANPSLPIICPVIFNHYGDKTALLILHNQGVKYLARTVSPEFLWKTLQQLKPWQMTALGLEALTALGECNAATPTPSSD